MLLVGGQLGPWPDRKVVIVHHLQHRYDLDRPQDVQLASFGVGRHFCLGASLARLESRLALEELVARVDGWEVDEAGAERVHSANVRGFARLPTQVSLRPGSP